MSSVEHIPKKAKKNNDLELFKFSAIPVRVIVNNAVDETLRGDLGSTSMEKNSKPGLSNVVLNTIDGKNNTDDDKTLRGQFGWMKIGNWSIPYIFRGNEKFCAVRILEKTLLKKYMEYLHQDLYNCATIYRYHMTEAESHLMNDINVVHCNSKFGKSLFKLNDLIMQLNDANELYNFLQTTLTKNGCKWKGRCGFIRINKEITVPYSTKTDQKYLPLFCLEGKIENLKMKRAEELKDWDLLYLKFCCKMMKIDGEFTTNNSCKVISLDEIKSCFPSDTPFEECWMVRP